MIAQVHAGSADFMVMCASKCKATGHRHSHFGPSLGPWTRLPPIPARPCSRVQAEDRAEAIHSGAAPSQSPRTDACRSWTAATAIAALSVPGASQIRSKFRAPRSVCRWRTLPVWRAAYQVTEPPALTVPVANGKLVLVNQPPGGDRTSGGADEMAQTIKKMIARTRPKDALHGLLSGVKLGALCAAGGVCGFFVLTLMGAKQGKLRGLLKGLVTGILGGAFLSCCAILLAVVQFARGIANTPRAFRAMREHQVWDASVCRWLEINLASLEHEMETDSEMEDPSGGGPVQVVAETELYDLFKINTSASPSELKKAYYREAKQCHPDTNPDDDEAAAKFQRLAEAYQILSDPELRSKYDHEGKAGLQEKPLSNIDSSMFFGLLFGCQAFEPWVGELQVAMQASQLSQPRRRPRQGAKKSMEAFTQEAFQERAALTERTLQLQRRREVACACHLRGKLDGWASDGTHEQDQWEALTRVEAADLAKGDSGPDLLIVLGDAYSRQSQLYMAIERSGAMSTASLVASMRMVWSGLQQQVHLSKSAVKSLWHVFRKVRNASKHKAQSSTSEERRRRVEEVMTEALPRFLQTVWGIVIKDVDRTARGVGQLLLCDKSVSQEVRRRRAQALHHLGMVFREEGLRARAARGKISAAADLSSSAAAHAKIQAALAGSVRRGGADVSTSKQESPPVRRY